MLTAMERNRENRRYGERAIKREREREREREERERRERHRLRRLPKQREPLSSNSLLTILFEQNKRTQIAALEHTVATLHALHA